MKDNLTSRHQRRSQRLRRLTTAMEARRAALQAGLDFRVSGENGTLVAHTHSLSWHRAKSPNITVPPQGRGWDRSSRSRIVGMDQTNAFDQDIRNQRDKQVTENPTI